MGQSRKSINHQTTFEERLAEEAERFKRAAEEQPLGSKARELLLRRARQDNFQKRDALFSRRVKFDLPEKMSEIHKLRKAVRLAETAALTPSTIRLCGR